MREQLIKRLGETTKEINELKEEHEKILKELSELYDKRVNLLERAELLKLLINREDI